MKRILSGLLAAFSLYSVLPLPAGRVVWDKEGMRYTLCFFPGVGVFIFGAQWLWSSAASGAFVSPVLFGAVAALLPVLLTGGIHMDGFIDAMDAIGSHAPPSRRLEILADPRVGAFGVMGCGGYFILSAGLWAQVSASPRHMAIASLGFVFSRAMASFSAALIPPAKKEGMMFLLHGSAPTAAVMACSAVFFTACGAAAVLLDPLCGALTSALCLLYRPLHRRFCLRAFGGNTGDLTGFFILNAELICLATAAAGGVFS
ncbi:MAG: adenosylcobinamide-GDP ribazoletransferase [Oscillospiraceae bacterium]|jgi:adenosylcobinamide-GDP ribazoletransferase|nr:adenosylcobinamide-GDP ribazoletransferase [Oscillospiraceae bacterium]